MQASELLRDIGTLSLAIAAVCAIVIGLLLIGLAWNTDKRRIFRYPPATAVSVGAPILFAAVHVLMYQLSGKGVMFSWAERGTVFYEVWPILTGIAWLNMLVLLIIGKLIPKEWRADRVGEEARSEARAEALEN